MSAAFVFSQKRIWNGPFWSPEQWVLSHKSPPPPMTYATYALLHVVDPPVKPFSLSSLRFSAPSSPSPPLRPSPRARVSVVKQPHPSQRSARRDVHPPRSATCAARSAGVSGESARCQAGRVRWSDLTGSVGSGSVTVRRNPKQHGRNQGF